MSINYLGRSSNLLLRRDIDALQQRLQKQTKWGRLRTVLQCLSGTCSLTGIIGEALLRGQV